MRCAKRKSTLVLLVTGCVSTIVLVKLFHQVQSSGADEAHIAGKMMDLPGEWHLADQTDYQPSLQQNGGRNDSGIPKMLHYVFKNHRAFELYKPMIRSCVHMNPDWQVFLWRDVDSAGLIKKYYKYFIEKYRNYDDRLEKSDSVRYMILHKFGGIYLDMDVQCLRPFNELLRLRIQSADKATRLGISAFLGEERREQTRILYGYSYCTMNSLMGSRPGHPFFQFVIRRMQSMPNLNHARLTTGPDFLTHAYHSWVNCSDCRANEPVIVLPARLVSPLIDTSLVNWESKCEPFLNVQKRKHEHKRLPSPDEAWRAHGCSELAAKKWNYNETDNGTIAVHRFLHLGYGTQTSKKTFDLLQEFPRIKLFDWNLDSIGLDL